MPRFNITNELGAEIQVTYLDGVTPVVRNVAARTSQDGAIQPSGAVGEIVNVRVLEPLALIQSDPMPPSARIVNLRVSGTPPTARFYTPL